MSANQNHTKQDSKKPRVFVGSSSETVKIANAIQSNLSACADVTVWTQSVFAPTEYVLDSLLSTLDSSDFGIFVASGDDLTSSRRRKHATPRDNVVFEIGLYCGRLGRQKAIVITPEDINVKLPSDLIGINTAKYNAHRDDGNWEAALGPACTSIQKILSQHNAKTTPIGRFRECDADTFVRNTPPKVDAGLGDKSNLNYLFLSVVDCDLTRDAIHELLHEIKTSKDGFQTFGAKYFELSGIYHLMGKWDLLVRYRMDPNGNQDTLVSAIRHRLSKKGMIEINGENDTFDLATLLDVQIEAPTVKALTEPEKEFPINRHILGGTEEYEKARSQRAFLYISLPELGTKSSLVRTALPTVLNSEEEPSTRIIESVSFAKRREFSGPGSGKPPTTALLLELFMTCGQTGLVNRLNRILEPHLGKNRCQKYTLNCFGYDELG